MNRLRVGLIAVVVVGGGGILFLFLHGGMGEASISGQVFDAANGMPVYGARITFDGRSTILYVSKDFRLTSLPRGKGELSIMAPGYYGESRKLTVNGKLNGISIALKGKEVPGLGGVLAWAKREGNDLRLDIRLTTKEGVGIEQFPSIPFGAEVKILENLGTAQDPIPGGLLYEGRPRLYLDLSAKLEKLKCKIGFNEIKNPQQGGATQGILELTLHAGPLIFKTTRGDIPLEMGAS